MCMTGRHPCRKGGPSGQPQRQVHPRVCCELDECQHAECMVIVNGRSIGEMCMKRLRGACGGCANGEWYQ